MNDGSVTFGWFVVSLFPLKEANWKDETAKGEKAHHPEGSDRPVREDSAGEFRQVHLANPSQQSSKNQIQGQSASD